jgi:hypothetical protein
LTREQGVRVQQARGRAVRQAVEQVMNRSNYRHLPDVTRTKNLEAAITNARRQATEQVKRELAGRVDDDRNEIHGKLPSSCSILWRN